MANSVLRIDHLILACPNLQEGISFYSDLSGAVPVPVNSDPQSPMHNAVVRWGNHRYLELLAPNPGRVKSEHRLPFGLAESTAPAFGGLGIAYR